MGRKRCRNPGEWTEIHIKKLTRKRLNKMYADMDDCNHIDDLINKLLDKK